MSLVEEQIDPGESEIFRKLIENNLKTIWSDGRKTKRGQHAKSHGCVDATFTVHKNLQDKIAHGVFKPGMQYDCVVRFSNGGQQDDRKEDVRGMAIKLKGVEGMKLLPGHGNKDEQDFILVDYPTYFTSNIKEYLTFNRHFTPVQSLQQNGPSIGRFIFAAWGMISLLLFNRKILNAARAFAGRRVGSPLSLTYHSTTPYMLGPDLAVKYKAIPRSNKEQEKIDTENGLGDTLWAALSANPQSFDFGVVVQTNASDHPIEDPSIDWEANRADYISLATITLQKQEYTPEKEERNLSLKFNPWMSISQHKPIGAINRARLIVYDAMSRQRQSLNSK